MATLAEVRLKEMEAMLSLRTANEAKLALAAGGVACGVCVCQGAPAGAMRQCELCRDAFHRGCVVEAAGGAEPRADGGKAWLCPRCRRSERPPLDRLLPLLASLQRLRVHLPEGDALRYLIERTAHWQQRLQQASASWKLPVAPERSAAHRWPGYGKTKSCPRAASCSPQEWSGTDRPHAAFYMEQRCIPLEGLNPELEELMVEGLLLQVSLPEIPQLHHILLNRPHKQRHSSQGTSSSQNRDGTTREVDRKAKRRLERESRDGGQGGHGGGARKAQKKAKLNKEKSRDDRSAPASSSCPASCPALCPAPSLSPSPSLLSEDSDEDIELCPAELCLQPEGDEVDWVQCDGSCNLWFHQVCVGVSAEQAEEEDYVCATCMRQQTSRR